LRTKGIQEHQQYDINCPPAQHRGMPVWLHADGAAVHCRDHEHGAYDQTVTVTRTGTKTYSVGSEARALEGDATFGSGSATTISFTSYGSLTAVAPQILVVQVAGKTRTVVVSTAGFARVK
jgi:hypothetical protein